MAKKVKPEPKVEPLLMDAFLKFLGVDSSEEPKKQRGRKSQKEAQNAVK